MMIYVGIDDTDVVGSPGTNQLARAIVRRLGAAGEGAVICRHQLFFDPRVPYTSKNGSASIQLPRADTVTRTALVDCITAVMRERYVEGSDPGLAIADRVPPAVAAFAARTQTEVVSQSDARDVAERAGCSLIGLAGTEQGVIGALAAVGLVAGGQDGRVVHLAHWPYPDEFSGVQDAAVIQARGVDEIRAVAGESFSGGPIDVGKHLRPNWRDSRIVLFVERTTDAEPAWRAIRMN